MPPTDTAQAVIECIAEAIKTHQPSHTELQAILGTLIAGTFLKTTYGDNERRLEAFDDFVSVVRAGLVREIEDGQAIEDTGELDDDGELVEDISSQSDGEFDDDEGTTKS